MKRQQRKNTKLRGAQIISSVSVALVLLILGIVALTGLTAHRVTSGIRSNIGFVVIVNDGVGQPAVDSLSMVLGTAPYVADTLYSPADVVLERWRDMMGEDMMADVNPFLPEYEVRVREGWMSADSLTLISERIKELTAVYDVKLHTDMVSHVNRTIHSAIMVLLVVAGALLLISFVLINNTVRLEVYSHRMVIHTMKYVGATAGFIRRPYVMSSVLSGIAAAAIASAVLAGLLYYVSDVNPAVMQAITWGGAAVVGAGLFVVGALLCALASLLATNKYLRKDYDEIFN